MSRVGKLAISIPSNVTVDISGLSIEISGLKGKLTKSFKGNIEIQKDDSKIKVIPLGEDRHSKAMWGTARSIINNMVKGVNEGFTQELEIKGVGYVASLKDKYLNLALGKSHSTKIEIPSYIEVKVPRATAIVLTGIDKELVGQFAALIIKQRPAEHYKEKGIKRKGQYVQIKESKKR